MLFSNDADRATTAKILGVKDWDEATDYRTTGTFDRKREEVLQLVTEHRRAALPEALNSDLGAILGMPNFRCGPIAHVYQKIDDFKDADGVTMAKASEIEQAFVILKLLRLWLVYGEDWQTWAGMELERAVDAMKAVKQ